MDSLVKIKIKNIEYTTEEAMEIYNCLSEIFKEQGIGCMFFDSITLDKIYSDLRIYCPQPVINRLFNVIKCSQITTLTGLSSMTEREFSKLRNVGQQTVKAAITYLRKNNMKFSVPRGPNKIKHDIIKSP